MHYGVVDSYNNLKHYTPIELPGIRWPHDLGVTRNYSILHDLPFIFDPELLAKGERKVTFFKDMPARFGIIPRHGTNDDVKWFEASPCFILHLSNCYENGEDEVVMEGCITTNPRKPAVGKQEHDAIDKMTKQFDKSATRYLMHRWTFNLKTGKTKEEYLDDEVSEFPTVCNEYVGKKYRYSYNALFGDKPWWLAGVKKYDLLTNSFQRYEFGEGRTGSEAHLALREGATDEDDGYLITMITDMIEDRSECMILDAKDISRGPVARIVLPQRIPIGAHACWVEADRIDGERV